MLLSLEAKLIGGALALAAALAAFAVFVHHERAIGAAAITAAVQKEADAASAANAIETTRRETAQQENLHEAQRFNIQAAADARGLDASVQRVRQYAASRRPAAADPAATPGSAPTDAAGTVPADVYLGLVDVARQLAEYADSAHGAGQLCAADYDALTH